MHSNGYIVATPELYTRQQPNSGICFRDLRYVNVENEVPQIVKYHENTQVISAQFCGDKRSNIVSLSTDREVIFSDYMFK